MASKGFTFKQFEVNHEGCAMKVGTDGVLLGAWCSCDTAQRIADIGTGTGLIALMCAQRNATATINAIEIDHSAAECARENISRSAWSDRIRVIETAIQNFDAEERYDLIVSNPPYFSETLQTLEGSPFIFSDNLKDVTCLAVNPPQAYDTIFPKDAVIKVPSGSVQSYRLTYPWSTYKLTGK